MFSFESQKQSQFIGSFFVEFVSQNFSACHVTKIFFIKLKIQFLLRFYNHRRFYVFEKHKALIPTDKALFLDIIQVVKPLSIINEIIKPIIALNVPLDLGIKLYNG